MFFASLAAGNRALRTHRGLAALLYLIQLGVALVLAVPLAVALSAAVAGTGFDADLAAGLDLVLLFDILEGYPTLVSTLVWQLVWIVPLVLVWKTSVGVGLVHALRDGGGRPFWSGVGRYFGRGLLLGLLFLVPLVVWLIVAGVLGFALNAIFSGEVAVFRIWFVLVPTVAVTGLSLTDAMHDYARIALVVEERPVFDAFLEGFRVPMRHATAGFLYIAWFIPAAVLWLAPTVVEAVVGASLLVFLAQQLLMLVRAGVTVAWFGSEVAWYQAAHRPAAIAEPAPGGADELDLPVGLA